MNPFVGQIELFGGTFAPRAGLFVTDSCWRFLKMMRFSLFSEQSMVGMVEPHLVCLTLEADVLLVWVLVQVFLIEDKEQH